MYLRKKGSTVLILEKEEDSGDFLSIAMYLDIGYEDYKVMTVANSALILRVTVESRNRLKKLCSVNN